MCTSCQPMCTVAGETSSPSGPSSLSTGFCVAMSAYGGSGTTMYMDGFTWTSLAPRQTCLAYLVPQLVIDRPWKLVIACLVTIAQSACIELVSVARMRLTSPDRLCLGLVLHAVSLTLAYIAMLFVMTYSIELFLAVIIGLLLGNLSTRRVKEVLAARDLRRAGAGQYTNFASRRPSIDAPSALGQTVGAGTPCCQLASGSGLGNRPSLEEVCLPITGMSCTACVNTVERALEALPGVQRASVSLKDNNASVVCNSPANLEEMHHAVLDVGFGIGTSPVRRVSSETTKLLRGQ